MSNNKWLLLITVLILSVAVIFTMQQKQRKSTVLKTDRILTEEETNWIKQHNAPLTVGITTIPNQVFKENNSTYKGFSIDLFHQLESILHTRFKFVYYETWDALIQAAKERKIDIVFAAQKTQDRLSYLNFTDTILTQQNKIIVNNAYRGATDIETLTDNGKTVSVTKGSAIYDYLHYYYPHIKLLLTHSEEEAIQAVSQKKADATISEAVRTAFYMEALNIQNVHIAGNLGYTYHLRIASRNDEPILAMILSKAVDAMSKEYLKSLQLKWGYIKDKENYFDTQTFIYLTILFGIVLPLALYLYVINRRLKEEILAHKTDIEKLNRATKEIRRLQYLAENEARTDTLTQIANRRKINELLYSQIEQHQTTQTPCSVLLIDIDHFKKVNDTMGHNVGDRVLSAFVKLIQSSLNPHDYFGRIGGEEFAVLLPHTSLETAVKIAERLRKSIEKYTFQIDGHIFQITASFGVTQIHEDDTIETLLKRADKMLYISKAKGRNRVAYR